MFYSAMLPILKYMFLAAQEIQKSVFYGYANGEVLFDDSIISTLEALHPAMDYFPRHLIVGKKFNLQVRSTDTESKIIFVQTICLEESISE